MRELILRQIDKKSGPSRREGSRILKEEKGIQGSTGGEKDIFFFFFYIALSYSYKALFS